MKKIYISTNIIKKIVISLIYSLFTGILIIPTLNMFNYKDMEILIISVFGHINPENILYVTSILIYVIYSIYLSYVLVDYMVVDINEHACYIFTRTGQKSKWFLTKCLNLFLYVLLYYILHFTIIIIIGIIYKFNITYITVFIVLKVFCLIVLFNYFIVLIINILCLYVNALKSYILVNVINIITLFTAGIYAIKSKYTKILMLLPISQSIASWHENMIPITQRGDIFDFYIKNFNFTYSIIYLFILCIICINIGVLRINKIDIL